jgi:dTDP-4-dehydrorhamnose reductase
MTDRQTAIELWGGVECTVNRVRDRYHSQLARNGHLARPTDIDRFAELGLRGLRVPILWELCQPEPAGPTSFAAFDPMLRRVRERGLRAIAGLVHHGSGPRHTSLLDPRFEHELAAYARRVAESYPWITDYTPVNEPLTTARFSGLYGHWYPHGTDNASFMRALVHQCRATIRAMAEIRKVCPEARLIQTEDIAYVRSTPSLAYQAEYENQRRFLSFDLLCGRVDPEHFMYQHLRYHGIGADELAWFEEHACTPDLLGVNYYFTSERYLDESLDAHPVWSHGGNGRHSYADVDAGLVKSLGGLTGHGPMLQTVWERYRVPVALTEVHAGCSREEQLRWLRDAWHGAHEARAAGADVRALTVWSLLGSYDWNSLVRVEAGIYEPGVFDLRGPEPRPTALAPMIASLARTASYEHPVLTGEGWWRRARSSPLTTSTGKRPLLITGAGGALARSLVRACEVRGLAYRTLTREELDITDRARVHAVCSELSPWALVNAAGFTRLDLAEQAQEACRRANISGPMVLAEACQELGVRFLTFSSNHVFDGRQQRPYVESDAVAPSSLYGSTQAQAEQAILDIDKSALIVRTSGLFGAEGAPRSQLAFAVFELLRGRPVRLPFHGTISPTYVHDLVTGCLDLLVDGASHLFHLANEGAVSGPEFLRILARVASLPDELVIEHGGLESSHPHPSYGVLGSERGNHMPTLEDAVARWWRASSAAASARGVAA